MARRVAIIGAGPSGLTAIRQAVQNGYEPVSFEEAAEIGGLWRYKPWETNESSVMKSTVINTSKEMTAYSEFPPPPKFANFMHNIQMLKYLKLYAEHFDLLRYVKFEHKVWNIERANDYDVTGQWTVKYRDNLGSNNEEKFDGVLVCTGHHTQPYFPEPWKGQHDFKGRIIHSHSYKDHRGFEDKIVVVVGIGNSGGDIAVELSRIAKQVYLVTRRGTWVINRIYDYGSPFDFAYNRRYLSALKQIVPMSITNWMIESKLQQRFDHVQYGLKPEHRVFSAHPTVNDELPNRIACGTVIIKPSIASFTANGIVFEDGTAVDQVDEVILGTGYSFEFPLLENGTLIPVVENQVELFEYMYPPELSSKNSMAILGLVQPLGSIMPISEMQARVFFEVFSKRCQLPSSEEMRADIGSKKAKMNKRYVKSRRHTIQVDYIEFMDELASLIGVLPDVKLMLSSDPLLALKVLFGPNVPYIYRLCGTHSWKGAREAILSVEERVAAPTRNARAVQNQTAPPMTTIFLASSLIIICIYLLFL